MTVANSDQNVGIGVAPNATARLNVDNVISLTGSTYNSGQPAYQIDDNNMLWHGDLGSVTNTFVGNTQNSTVTGTNNTALGYRAHAANTAGYENTVMGSNAGGTSTAAQNVLIGFNAGIGAGPRNVIIGNRAGETTNGTAREDVMIGMYAGQNVTSGNQNVYLGTRAGRANATGTHNLMAGQNAGAGNTGSRNVILGSRVATTNFVASSDVLLIDNSDNPTPLVQGNFSTDQFTLNVDPNTDASFLVTGVSGDDNIQFGSLQGAYAADVYGARVNDGIVVADGNGNLRKVAIPGSTFLGRLGVDVPGFGGAPTTVLTVNANAAGTYEVQVYVMYSGVNPLESVDASIIGVTVTDLSWGVVSSGQALEPSNVDGVGSAVTGIGVGSIPTNRLTIVIKGIVDVSAAGDIHFQSALDPNITFHKNSFIKLTRL